MKNQAKIISTAALVLLAGTAAFLPSATAEPLDTGKFCITATNEKEPNFNSKAGMCAKQEAEELVPGKGLIKVQFMDLGWGDPNTDSVEMQIWADGSLVSEMYYSNWMEQELFVVQQLENEAGEEAKIYELRYVMVDGRVTTATIPGKLLTPGQITHTLEIFSDGKTNLI